MVKKYLNKNVYESSIERIEYIFNEFDNVLVAFSGGKDSTVCLNLCYDYAKRNNLLSKLSMYHLDYEAQYEMTTNFVDETFKKFNDIKRFWLCLPVAANCGCKMDSGTWIPWNPIEKEIWCRDYPEYDYVVKKAPFKMEIGERDYDVQDKFGKWFADKYGKTAVVVGIRTDESLNRFRAISSEHKVKPYNGKMYITGYLDVDNCYKAYPIYDWNVDDIWIYNYKFEKEYNKLYDLYYQAGLSVDQMRVANPFHCCGEDTLRLYKVIEPNTWGKLISRVNGVNFMGIYGGTTAMGWKSITKPKHFTWKEYCYFLLNTLDEKTKKHYLEKLNTSIQFWKEKGGALDDETIEELNGKGKIGLPNNYSNKKTVTFEDYPDDLEIKNFKDVPSYKRMCVCILKNDYFCKYMGFAQTKTENQRRKEAMSKYANL